MFRGFFSAILSNLPDPFNYLPSHWGQFMLALVLESLDWKRNIHKADIWPEEFYLWVVVLY